MRTRSAKKKSSEASSVATRGTRRKRGSDSIGSPSFEDLEQDLSTGSGPDPRSQPASAKRLKKTPAQQILQQQEEEEEEAEHLHGDTPSLDGEKNDNLPMNGPMTDDLQNSKKVRFSYPTPITNPQASNQDVLDVRHGSPIAANHSSPSVAAQANWIRKSRHSLPARLPSSNALSAAQVQFYPLQAVLDDRVRRRLRRNHLSEEVNDIDQNKRHNARREEELKKLRSAIEEKDQMVKDLMLEVEERRQMGIELTNDEEVRDNHLKSLEDELLKLRIELESRQNAEVASSSAEGDIGDAQMDEAISGDSNNDEDGSPEIFLVDHSDDDAVPAEMTPLTRFGLGNMTPISTSQQSNLDPTREQEIRRFEQTIKELSRKLADANAAMESITIELRSLGFTEEDSPLPEDVLSAIRTAFLQTRIQTQELWPDQPVDRLINVSFLSLIVNKLRALLAQAQDQLKRLHGMEETNASLKWQQQGLLETISDLNEEKVVLEDQRNRLDETRVQHEIRVHELKGQVGLLNRKNDEIALENLEYQDRIIGLEENTSRDGSIIQQLRSDIENWRNELEEAQVAIEQMLNEHAQELEQLNQEKTEAITHYTTELADESTQKDLALRELEQSHDKIIELEDELVRISQDHQHDTEDKQSQFDRFTRELDITLQQVDKLAVIKENLERRVEHEASQMLVYQDRKEQEVDVLKSRLQTMDAKLSELKESSRERQESLENDVEGKNLEIESLKVVIAGERSKIEDLRNVVHRQNDQMRRLSSIFEATLQQVGDSNTQVESIMQEAMRQVSGVHSGLASALLQGRTDADSTMTDGEVSHSDVTVIPSKKSTSRMQKKGRQVRPKQGL